MSMPFFGLLSFLLRRNRWKTCRICVSMPSSGFYHFYDDTPVEKVDPVSVSMPFFGLLSFLRRSEMFFAVAWRCVNALLRASIISTTLRNVFRRGMKMCQCPLRASIISTVFWCDFWRKEAIVSMPFFGLLSFLLGAKNRELMLKKSVNALLRASIISTLRSISSRIISDTVSMPFFGLLSFLQYPPETLCL